CSRPGPSASERARSLARPSMRVKVRAHFEGRTHEMRRSLLGIGLALVATVSACNGAGPAGETDGTQARPGNGGKGSLHTDGSQIADENGRTVRMTGVNWFGLETQNFTLHGLWARSLDSMLDQIRSLGYNSIRVPYSNQLFDAASTPSGID